MSETKRKATMIPMSRIRHIVETWGDEYDEVPWGLFLVVPPSERPLTEADVARVREIAAQLEADRLSDDD